MLTQLIIRVKISHSVNRPNQQRRWFQANIVKPLASTVRPESQRVQPAGGTPSGVSSTAAKVLAGWKYLKVENEKNPTAPRHFKNTTV